MAIYALARPVFKPAMRIITAITNAPIVMITTSFAHGYISNTIVRIDIPTGFGMQQLNQQIGPITVTGTTTFTMPIDTTQYDVFAPPVFVLLPSHITVFLQQAQVVPMAEDTSILTAAVQNVLPYP